MGLRRGARTSVIGPIYFRCISFSGWLGPEQVTQDLTHYTNEYYQRELTFCRFGILRSDQLAALCYILDWAYWGPKDANWQSWGPKGLGRDPGVILSMGAGRGELEVQLEVIGHEVIAVDPSPGAQELYKGKGPLHRECSPELARSAQTVVFCESMEHIPLHQTRQVLSWLQPGTRLVVVNFVDFWPIFREGEWDHITQVDDALYDEISAGRQVLFRRGSHLVLTW